MSTVKCIIFGVFVNCINITFNVLYNHSKQTKSRPEQLTTKPDRHQSKKRKVSPLYQGERKKTMKKIKIENGKLYSSRMPLCEGIDVFEIVEKIPENYFVWNIGENMGTDEYIPLVEDLHPEDKDNYEINRHTLKTIKLTVEEVKLLRRAANYGIVSKATAEKALRNKRHGYMSDRKKAEAENAIDVFKRISE